MICLLVDPSEFVCAHVSGRLTQEGIEVKVARTGAEAVRLAAAFSPNTILIDVLLPDADGMDVVENLRESHPSARIVVTSQSLAKAQVARLIQKGLKEIWLKPYRLDSLAEKLKV